ncbi:TM2 domain-containing protein [Luteolibacter sp. AS25]|uniref:TM2 domain-containing protein n=1 Tax=Luteolibacter sp. AS25 TaxID=3135776 RepID=UPI00398AAAA6
MSEESPTPESSAPQTPPPSAETTAAAPTPPPAGQYSKEQTDKKLIGGILAIVLGAFGVHKFYLGYQKEGIIMLIVGVVGLFICGFPTLAVGIVGLVEGILYLTKTDNEFVSTYVIGRKPWF